METPRNTATPTPPQSHTPATTKKSSKAMKNPAVRITLAYLAAFAAFIAGFLLSILLAPLVFKILGYSSWTLAFLEKYPFAITTFIVGILSNLLSFFVFNLICKREPPFYPAFAFCLLFIIFGAISTAICLAGRNYQLLPLPILTLVINAFRIARIHFIKKEA